MCTCEFTPDPEEPGEEPWHYLRTCPYPECGKQWWGLHCPHDGVQTLCPYCHHTLRPVPDVEAAVENARQAIRESVEDFRRQQKGKP
jgi:hypothetical protein